MKEHKVEQNTDEWLDLRRGKFTASTFKELFMAKSTAGYKNAIKKVVYEKLTGESPEFFQTEYMKRGHELEPVARSVYENETFNVVEDAGFFELSEWIGASPDGLVGTDGIIEIKCPAYSTMIDYLIYKNLPNQYKWQVYGQLWVTGRKWCDFMAFHPKLKPVIIRIERDEVIITELIVAVNNAIKDTENIINKLK